MKVTQYDIAKKLGISRTTVARALNGSTSIRENKKREILALAEKMGYKKDTVGSMLATKKNKNIYVFIVKSINESYNTQLHKGFEMVKEEYSMLKFNFHIIETDISRPQDQLDSIKNLLINYVENNDSNDNLTDTAVDGIIITPLIGDEIESIINKYSEFTEFLVLDSYINDSIEYISLDYEYNAKVSATIVDRVLRKGEKVLLFDSDDDKISSGRYYKGFYDKISATDKTVINLGKITMDSKDLYERVNSHLLGDEIVALYTPRYASYLLDELIKNEVDFSKVKMVCQSKGNEMNDYLVKNYVVAVVKEKIDTLAYEAGKCMIDKLFYQKQSSFSGRLIKPTIYFIDLANNVGNNSL